MNGLLLGREKEEAKKEKQKMKKENLSEEKLIYP